MGCCSRFFCAIEVVNIYPWLVWTKNYKSQVSHRDYYLQLTLSLIALTVAAFLVTEGLLEIVGVPVISADTIISPSPEKVAALFAKLSAGELSTVTCPCSSTTQSLSNVSSWAFPEDSFCTVARGTARLAGLPPVAPFSILDFLALLNDPANDNCIGAPGPTPGTGDAAWTTFVGHVTALATAGALFPATLPPEDLAQDLEAFAKDVQEGLCGLAFGTISPKEFFPFPISGNPVNPILDFLNPCHDDATNPDDTPILLAPGPALSYSPENFVQVQRSRARTLYSASVSTCSTLNTLRKGFLSAAQGLPLTTNLALPPADLGRAVENIWKAELSARASTTSSLVPGFATTGEPLVENTEAFAVRLLAAELNTARIIPADTMPFSSRLPFVRADSVAGGGRFFYVLADSASPPLPVPREVIVFAGEARVVVNDSNNLRYPFIQTDSENANNQRTSPGYVAGVTPGWAPVGDDMLTILDICSGVGSSAGASLAIDVHNLRPTSTLTSRGAQFPDLDEPYDVMLPNPFPSNPQGTPVCAMGAPAPPPATGPGPRAPQPVLFRAPLRCPPFLTWLGRLRANSTFFAANSALRFPISDFVALFPPGVPQPPPELLNPAQLALVNRFLEGDLAARAQLLTGLGAVAQGPTFNHSPLAHYALCAPAKCTTTVVEDPTLWALALEGLGILGGTTAAVMGAFSWFIWLTSMVAQECCGGDGGGRRRRRKRRRGGARRRAPERGARRRRRRRSCGPQSRPAHGRGSCSSSKLWSCQWWEWGGR